MRIFITIAVIFFVSFSSVNAQHCPRNFYDCKGACGWFVDKDNDGYCDLTNYTEELLQKLKAKKDSAQKAAEALKPVQPVKDTVKSTENKNKNVTNNKTESQSNAPETTKYKCPFADAPPCARHKSAEPTQPKNENVLTNTTEKPKQTFTKKHYDIIPIFTICLALYAISSLLVSRKKIRKSTHRRIWNVLLLLTFITAGFSGLFMVIQLNYSIKFDWFATLLYWHVQFGISMAAISILHILWHWKYFRNMLLRKKEENECM